LSFSICIFLPHTQKKNNYLFMISFHVVCDGFKNNKKFIKTETKLWKENDFAF
jgi:hypothetical protein